MSRLSHALVRVVPQSLVMRVYALYSVTLLLFVSTSLGLFYQYQFKGAMEGAQASATMLVELVAQTVSDNAVIGDYDTIKRMLNKAILRSQFDAAQFIDLAGGVVKSVNEVNPAPQAPAWLRDKVDEQLYDLNKGISGGGKDYGVLRLSSASQGIWRHHLGAMAALARRRVGELPASYPLVAVDVGERLGPVYQRMIDGRHGCAVITEQGGVAGIVTRSDLLDALARGATRDSPIRSAMNARPLCLSVDDSAATAAERMAERGLKFLPVVNGGGRPVALLTSDDFVRFALSMPR